MDRQRFEQIIEAYGADPRRWPVAEREAALRWLEATSDPGQAVALAEARVLDRVLDGAAAPAISDQLRARVATSLRAGSPRWSWVASLAAACLAGISVALLFGMDLATRQYEVQVLSVLQGDGISEWIPPTAESR